VSKEFYWTTDCTRLPMSAVTELNKMIDMAKEITLRTFRQHCHTKEWEESMGYDRSGQGGLPLSKDWHVRFYRSKWKGQRVYYVVHSSIEHIFTKRPRL